VKATCGLVTFASASALLMLELRQLAASTLAALLLDISTMLADSVWCMLLLQV
jgi:hypothetical protein